MHGILNLTHYEAPDPRGYFFGQRQLSTEIRDLYGLLIDGMQGSRGAIRSGGDMTSPAVRSERPTQEPLRAFPAVVKTGPDGKARIDFDLPAFNGTVKVMAVAWTKTKAGSASTEVIVRDPVVALVTVPRFLSLGDRSQFSVADRQCRRQARRLRPRSRPSRARSRRRPMSCIAHSSSTPGQRKSLTSSGHGNRGWPRRRRSQTDRPGLGRAADARARRLAGHLEALSPLGAHARRRRRASPSRNDLVADFVPGTGGVSLAVSLACRNRCSGPPASARSLSLWLFRADRQPCPAASLCEQTGQERGARDRSRMSISASARPSSGCWRGRIRTAPLAFGRPPMPTTCGCMPSSPIF